MESDSESLIRNEIEYLEETQWTKKSSQRYMTFV